MTKIRFNAPKHHVFRCGDLELHGGDEKNVPEELADQLSSDPAIEIVGGRTRGKQADTTTPEPGDPPGDTPKED